MNSTNRLADALERGLAPGGNLTEELDALGDFGIESPSEAQAIVDALQTFIERPVELDDFGSTFRALTGLFQSVMTAQIFRQLTVSAIPLLIDAYDARLEQAEEHQGDLMLALKVFARYGTEEGLNRVVAGAFNPALCDDFLWPIIFDQIGDDDPIITDLIQRLSNPLPDGLACVAFVDWVNRLLREDILVTHPLNSPEGIERLQAWLTSTDEIEFSRAHSATAAIPFISEPHRSSLLSLAMDHQDIEVQMEAAWASAYLGSEGGEKFLARMCLEADYSMTARRYLEELGKQDSIPEEADEPDFRAMAEACFWLADPREFGRSPDDIELFDSRELHWPPTNDWRSVWLFRYSYLADDPEDRDETGIIMVGGLTFSLDDEVSEEMSPEDIYAIHCCWELEVREDARAPETRTVEAGRALLASSPQEPPDPSEDF